MAKLLLLQDAASDRAKIRVFGSALHGDRIRDVDIAVITDDLEILQAIRAQLSTDRDLQIVDLIAFSGDEEKELGFLKTVGAV